MAASKRHRSGRVAIGALLIAAMLAVAQRRAAAQVELRSVEQPWSVEVVGVGPEGVTVVEGQDRKVISWDRVRGVSSAKHAAAAMAFAGVSEQLWRARTRVERGDFDAAEPLLDGLIDRRPAVLAGPTAAVAYEALLRCRSNRGSVTGAVLAWLEWRRARSSLGSEGVVGGTLEMAPVFDPVTGLAPALPPVFLNDPATGVGVQSDEWTSFAKEEGGGDGRTRVLAELYLAAARFDTGQSVVIAPVTSSDPGVKLVADVVLARAGDEQQRAAARASLEARLSAGVDRARAEGGGGLISAEDWVECWCRLGLGRSLVREQDEAARRLGVIHLLHVPARFSRVSPVLASVALADAAAALHGLGDHAGARAVKAELVSRYPRHSAVNDTRLRDIQQIQGEAPATSSAETGVGGAP